MKFGTQLKSKSVPEWRSYNIDYNDLKHRIRITTEVPPAKNAAYIKDLHSAFIDQIDMVNLFLQSKVGEVKRRIVYVENTVEQLETVQLRATSDPNDDNDQVRSKIYEELRSNMDRLSSDLQKLSRFIVLQKTGLRKLLKKYTKYSGDGGKLNLEINKYMVKNQDSFIYIDLTGFYLELALIYDLIRTKQSPDNVRFASNDNTPRRNRRASYADPVVDLNMNEVFDFENIKNGSQKEHFLVHYDNLTELKLFLLSNFYYVDESVRHERRNIQLQRQKSAMSFRQLIGRRTSIDNLNKKQDEQKKKNDEVMESLDDTDRTKDIQQTNTIYLNNTDQLSNSGDCTIVYLDDPKHLQSIKTDGDPGILITDASNNQRSLLISAIGGLRNASNALLQDTSFVDDLLRSCVDDESYETFLSRHAEFIQSLDSLEKISIEWIFSKHIKPLVKANCTKTRFTSTRSIVKSKPQSWITLSSNIKYSSTDLASHEWTSENESSCSPFPYALLEIRYTASSTSIQIPEELTKLMKSHLVHKVESTFNPLTYHLFTSNSLSFEPSWAQYFGENPTDIHKNPPREPRRPKSNLRAGNRTDSTVSLSTRRSDSSNDKNVSAESSQFRYWNEFDNGSEGEDNTGFFVDVESNDDQFFSNGSMEYLLKVANNVSTFMQEKIPFLFPTDHHYDPSSENTLLNHGNTAYHNDTYGSMLTPSISTRAESDVESMDDRVVDDKHSHALFRIFLALSLATVSLILVSLAMGVITALWQFDDVSINPLVSFILILTFFTSMGLSVVSIGLIMAVEEYRRMWQVAYVWISCGLVLGIAMFGTIALLGL